MADVDEDAFARRHHSTTPSHHSPGEDEADDPTDEMADYSLLNTSLPSRGLKDFEPTSLSSQRSALAASRQAMLAALSFPRLHSGKSHMVGVFVGAEPEKWFGGEGQGRCVRVDLFRGGYAKTMGVGDRWNRVWLNGEEGLFLLERGGLDVRWPRLGKGKRRKMGSMGGSLEEKEEEDLHGLADGVPLPVGGGDEEEKSNLLQTQDVDVEEDKDEEEEDGLDKEADVEASELPMSLQGAYATLLGKSGLTLERYIVYAVLRRSGYTVVRAPTWSDKDSDLNGHVGSDEPMIGPAQHIVPSSGIVRNVSSLAHKLVQYLFTPDQTKACSSLGPLVAPGLYRNYNDIFRALSLIPYHEPTTTPPRTHQAPPFRIAYYVYKPNTPYRKTLPPPPDFRIVVMDARSSSVPTLDQIGALLDSMPADELPAEKRLEQRLKHGRRNVILAVVDSGVASYMRLSEACFGGAKLYEQPKRLGGKGGPRGKRGK